MIHPVCIYELGEQIYTYVATYHIAIRISLPDNIIDVWKTVNLETTCIFLATYTRPNVILAREAV